MAPPTEVTFCITHFSGIFTKPVPTSVMGQVLERPQFIQQAESLSAQNLDKDPKQQASSHNRTCHSQVPWEHLEIPGKLSHALELPGAVATHARIKVICSCHDSCLTSQMIRSMREKGLCHTSLWLMVLSTAPSHTLQRRVDRLVWQW